MNAEPSKPAARTDFATGTPPAPVPRIEDEADEPVPNIRAEGPSAMEVFFAWEKRRVLYNVILSLFLAIFGSGFRGGAQFAWTFIWTSLVVLNTCFCVCPTIECYLFWFGLQREWSRRIVFVVVTLGSMAAPVLWVVCQR